MAPPGEDFDPVQVHGKDRTAGGVRQGESRHPAQVAVCSLAGEEDRVDPSDEPPQYRLNGALFFWIKHRLLSTPSCAPLPYSRV